MRSLITSYLLQSKECILPGIGVLQIIHTPASSDRANKLLLPAYEAVLFKKEDHQASPGLIKYISTKKHIDQTEAKDLLDDFCTGWKEKVDAGERLHFETIGSIYKNADNTLVFEKEKGFNFLHPINVDSVYQKADAPAVIEQEPEPVLPGINVYKEEKIVVEKSYWGLWALILLAVGFVMLFYYFKDHKITNSNIGNQHKFIIDSAGASYHLPK